VAHFVTSGYPWFIRGAAYNDGLITGVFAFHNEHGSANVGHSFRVVLCTIFVYELNIRKGF